jgi:hypothetical protein
MPRPEHRRGVAVGALRAAGAADRRGEEPDRFEHVYRRAMSTLVDVNDLAEVAGTREPYRRLARTSDDLRQVEEHVWYSVLKVASP